MASAILTARPTISHLQQWPEQEKRAKSPYGLPIVEDCLHCQLRGDNFFCKISEASRKALDRIKHTTSYPAGALLFLEGQAPRGVYVLCQGRAKLMMTNAEGRTLILKIAEAGEILGLNSVITGRPHEVALETLQPSQISFIGREDFLKLMKEDGHVCLQVVRHLSRDCQEAHDSIRSIGLSHSASGKLARFLLDWCAEGQKSDGGVRKKLSLTHEEMAQLIGSSRETVTRTLSEFKRENIAELSGSTLVVLDQEALESLAAA
jgi:CRP/FNR family transcriptional regulator, cyclic AMP receptor protein